MLLYFSVAVTALTRLRIVASAWHSFGFSEYGLADFLLADLPE
jgi:hypothetical protein